LFDATSNIIQTGTQAQVTAALTTLDGKKGWYIDLSSGEKVLSRVRLFRNRVLFNSFKPVGSSVCNLNETKNQFYALSLHSGVGLIPVDLDNDFVIDQYDRSIVASDQVTILDEPAIVTYHDPGDPTPSNGDPPTPPTSCSGVYGGTQKLLTICSSPIKVNWMNTR
jgi:hypothetical protein